MSEAGDSIDESPAPEALEPQPDPPKPYPGFWQAISILLGYVVLQLVFLIPFFIADAVWKGNYSKHPIALLTAIVGPGLIIILRACSRQGISFATLAGHWPGAFVLAPLLATVVGLLFAEGPVIVWVGRRFPSLLASASQDYGSSRSLWWAFLVIVVAAPLIEESIFRGIMAKGFIARYQTTKGVLLSALLFGAIHASVLKLIPTIALGLILGWLYGKFKSIWPGVLAHALNNSLAFLTIAVGVQAKKTSDLGHFTWGEPVICVAGLLLLAYGIFTLRRLPDSAPTISES